MSLLGNKLKALRKATGLSQEAVGAQGFVSTPGWIKIENGQRKASDKLIEVFVKWLVKEKHVKPSAAGDLEEELLLWKYLEYSRGYVSRLASLRLMSVPWGNAIFDERRALANGKAEGKKPRKP